MNERVNERSRLGMIERPSYEALLRRVEKLEKHEITLSDLPQAALQRQLEQRWQPEGSLLLQPGSIRLETLGCIDYGTVSVNLSNQSDATLAVPHRLERAPVGALAVTTANSRFNVRAGTDSTNVSLTVRHIDSTATSESVSVFWLVLG